ncbi:hypothetical protein V6N11_053137 [Hibiscus sabdariffa]|uniref:RNase H type-1 domain-containing protein n=1 Tax=Hibiscus sabdariffa TaxID=183260 RepID=A0ABR2UC81_9ROSI
MRAWFPKVIACGMKLDMLYLCDLSPAVFLMLYLLPVLGVNQPPVGWIKVNTDDARDPNSGATFPEGVGRDSNMRWRFGFSKKLGICSAFDAELWVMYERLETAWSFSRNWEVSFKCVNRQCNYMADKLVKMTKVLLLAYYKFLDLPAVVLDLFSGNASVDPSNVS